MAGGTAVILLLLATAAMGGEGGHSMEDIGSQESQESQEEGVEEEGYMLAGDIFRCPILPEPPGCPGCPRAVGRSRR